MSYIERRFERISRIQNDSILWEYSDVDPLENDNEPGPRWVRNFVNDRYWFIDANGNAIFVDIDSWNIRGNIGLDPEQEYIGNYDNVDLPFRTNNEERLKITAGGNVIIGGGADSNSALLNLYSLSKGFLPPRMDSVQKSEIVSPEDGLIVFDTDLQRLSIYYSLGWHEFTFSDSSVTSFNERQGDVYLTSLDVTSALGFTPEDVSNKSTTIVPELINDTNYPTTSAVFNWVTGLGYITSADLSGYATQAWVNAQGFITNVITALGYTPENAANKTTSITGNETSNTLFPTVKSVVDWVTSLFIKRGTNTLNYVQKVTSTGTIGDSSIFDNGTFVGVGTTSDTGTGKVQVSGNLALRNSAPILNLVSSPGSGGRIYWNDGSNRFALAYQAFQGGEPTGSLNLYSYAASKTVLSVTSGGQLLVGVPYPINTNYAVSAQLEVASTTKGFLQPRMTTTQRNAIATPAAGLSIYNTTTKTEDYYDGTSWVSLQTTAAAVKSYGAFQDDATQYATDDNIGYGVRFDVNDINGHGVEIIPDSFGNNTLIKFDNAGTYNLQFSFQFQNADSQLHDVTVWLRKNGEDTSADVAGTGGFVSVPNSHGGINGHNIVAWNYFVEANANDYYQIVWSTTNKDNVTMEFYPAGSPPPSCASAILTVNQIN